MAKVNAVQPAQLLSARAYAVIALFGLAVAICFTVLYIYLVPRLVQNGAQDRVFYVLLIPWGLASAAFLFGAMGSFAHFTHKHLGNALVLGGPVVLFCLVIVGGFKLVPPLPETFDLTVRPHGPNGTDPVIMLGEITIDFDNYRRSQPLSSNGEADFKGVPAKFRGATVGVVPRVDGYIQEWQHLELKGMVLDLTLRRELQPVTHLTGSIAPPPKDWAELRIMVDGQSAEGKVDQLGGFNFQVTGREGATIRLKIYDGTNLVYDDFQTLPGPLTLALHSR